jgi:hypothetical protein
MTSSQWLDIAIVAIASVAAISGWRSGALGSLASFVGVVLGAVAGVLLAPHLVGQIDSPRPKLFATLFLILALVVIGEIAGVVVGRAVRGAIRHGGLRVIDSAVGVALQLVVVLAAAWLLGCARFRRDCRHFSTIPACPMCSSRSTVRPSPRWTRRMNRWPPARWWAWSNPAW